MSIFKELVELVRLLFVTNPKDVNELEIVEFSHFPFKGFLAMSWCGKLITREPDKISDTTKRHETTHLMQAKQYRSWVRYYLVYLKEWFKGNYYTIPFEVEAYANEDVLDYNDLYDPNTIKEKYTFKGRRSLFKSFRTVYEWKRYIKKL